MTYLMLYGGLVFGGAISHKHAASFRRFLFVFFSLLLFGFVAFRYEVGCDWTGYINNFNESRYWSVSDALSRSETAYWLLLVQIHSSGLEYPYLNLFMAIPFFVGLVALARRQPDPLAFIILSFPVLIINMPMSAIRQSAAIGFICLALIAFMDRRLVRYVALVGTAALFHTSAIVFLALAPFTKFALSRTAIALSALLLLPGGYLVLADALGFYADRYVDTRIDAAGAIFRSGMLAAVGIFFFLVLRRPYRERFPKDYPIVLIGAVIMIATLPLVAVSSVISDRFGYYVTPIQLIILARIPYLVEGRNKIVFSAAPYLVLGLVLFVWAENSRLFNLCYVPYKTWLSWEY
jgi:hypothetical protein